MMMQTFTFKTITSLLILSILFSSCTQRIYFPDKVVVPGLTEQFETKLNVSTRFHTSATTDTFAGPSKWKASPSFDLAFAPLNHVGIFASYKTLIDKRYREKEILFKDPFDLNNAFGGTFNDRIIEFGIGYFNKLGNKSKYEIYAGYGAGNLKRTGELFKEYDFTSNYHRFFIQPAVGIDFKSVSLMFGVKVLNQQHDNFNAPLYPDLRKRLGIGGADILQENFWLFQPFINVEVGLEYLKFNAQFGYGTSSHGTLIYGNRPIAYGSIGVVGLLKPSFLKNNK